MSPTIYANRFAKWLGGSKPKHCGSKHSFGYPLDNGTDIPRQLVIHLYDCAHDDIELAVWDLEPEMGGSELGRIRALRGECPWQDAEAFEEWLLQTLGEPLPTWGKRQKQTFRSIDDPWNVGLVESGV